MKPPARRPHPWSRGLTTCGLASCGLGISAVLLAGLGMVMLLNAQQHDIATPLTISHGGANIEVALPQEPMRLSPTQLQAWVTDAATAVSHYYGHFPVAHLMLRIRVGRGSRIHGVTYARGGGLILATVGSDAEVEDLNRDWVLTHEMTHLAFPSMPEEQHWIEEGLATYVEPVARAQVNQLAVAEVWRQFIRDMPKGQPGPDDGGLDHTPTWGRTYWGGATYCLLADVQIRERTHNRKGLRDALRAIVDNGGTISQDGEIEQVLAVGDKATGAHVLLNLYHQMRDKPVSVDLDDLWNRLGVALKDDEVIFNDKAREAPIRRAITSPQR